MQCAACKQTCTQLKLLCADCREPVWCSDSCAVIQQTVHVGCGNIGARRPVGAVRGLFGKSDFRGTLSNLFTALLDVRPMKDAYDAEYNNESLDPTRLAKAAEALASALRRVDTRINDFDKMLDSVDKKVGTVLMQTRTTLKAALRYDTTTALRLALRRDAVPGLGESLDPDLTFSNSFAWAEKFVSASATTHTLLQSSPTQPLASQFIFALESPDEMKVSATRAFKAALRKWTTALDADFSKLIKKA
jgi:hypothetical protein